MTKLQIKLDIKLEIKSEALVLIGVLAWRVAKGHPSRIISWKSDLIILNNNTTRPIQLRVANMKFRQS